MIIRKIKPEEKLAADMIDTVCFAQTNDYAQRVSNPLMDTDGYESTWAAFDDNGVMMSRIIFHPFEVMYDSHRVKMSGVGGVAVLPEYRSGGVCKGIMEQAMRDMYDTGVVFSYLYPFSHNYYRKFGYELCYNNRTASIPLSNLKNYSQSGSIEALTKDADIEPYINIYKKFISGYNLAVVRSKKKFEELLLKDPYKTRQYTYLWKDDDGKPQSYLCFSASKKDNETEHRMNVVEFAWESVSGFRGMLAMLPRFCAQYGNMYWELPSSIEPYAIINEPYEISVRTACGGMNRVINVSTALSLMKPPEGSGSVIISVSDSFLKANSGAYKISWDNGRLTAEKSAKPADAAIDINSLAQLITGYCTADMLELTGRIEVLKNSENLNRLFHKKNLYIKDRF